MPLRKREPGTGLQILLEFDGAFRVCKCDDDDDLPRSAIRGVARRTSVMLLQPQTNVCGEPGVVASWIALALQEIDESLQMHSRDGCKSRTVWNPVKFLRTRAIPGW